MAFGVTHIAEGVEVDGDFLTCLDVAAGEVVVLLVDPCGRHVRVADVPTNRHLVRVLGAVQPSFVEHAILQETLPEKPRPFLRDRERPELVVALGEQRELGPPRDILGGEDADFHALQRSAGENG